MADHTSRDAGAARPARAARSRSGAAAAAPQHARSVPGSPKADPVWGVRVNETGIFATGLGAKWWAEALAPWELSSRALCLGISPGGGVWFLPAGEKDDAEWMRDHITSHGVHHGHVKVTTKVRAEAERDERTAAYRTAADATRCTLDGTGRREGVYFLRLCAGCNGQFAVSFPAGDTYHCPACAGPAYREIQPRPNRQVLLRGCPQNWSAKYVILTVEEDHCEVRRLGFPDDPVLRFHRSALMATTGDTQP